jgi:hypothetical protein
MISTIPVVSDRGTGGTGASVLRSCSVVTTADTLLVPATARGRMVSHPVEALVVRPFGVVSDAPVAHGARGSA